MPYDATIVKDRKDDEILLYFLFKKSQFFSGLKQIAIVSRGIDKDLALMRSVSARMMY